jgi:hypothetical protein
MVNRKTMSYLTEPLRVVAQRHLKPEEIVLTAIYAHPTVLHSNGGWLWFTGYRQIHHPARAFVLTPDQVLILLLLLPTVSIFLLPAHSTE